MTTSSDGFKLDMRGSKLIQENEKIITGYTSTFNRQMDWNLVPIKLNNYNLILYPQKLPEEFIFQSNSKQFKDFPMGHLKIILKNTFTNEYVGDTPIESVKTLGGRIEDGIKWNINEWPFNIISDTQVPHELLLVHTRPDILLSGVVNVYIN